MPRPRDYAFEALAEVSGTDPNTGRGELNAALKSIREESKIEDSYILAYEIHQKAKLYRQLMPEVMLTPTALSKHWTRVGEETEQRKAKGANVYAEPTECATCGGIRFVLVARRPAKQSVWMKQRGIEIPDAPGAEEYAPCPDCNQQDASFRRADGTLSASPNPSLVRDRMTSPPATSRPQETPEWVLVWSWARYRRAPRCLIPFPQQAAYLNPDEKKVVMSEAGYEELRQEWEAAGSPKAEHPIPLAQ